jgi:outer membrane biosynthesis protein TonB
MHRTLTVLATLSLVAAGFVASTASATEPASKPAEAQPTTLAPEAAKITKSRSNIQNNRESTAPESTAPESTAPESTAPESTAPESKPAPAPAPEAQVVVKTKTKSNQSND